MLRNFRADFHDLAFHRILNEVLSLNAQEWDALAAGVAVALSSMKS